MADLSLSLLSTLLVCNNRNKSDMQYDAYSQYLAHSATIYAVTWSFSG